MGRAVHNTTGIVLGLRADAHYRNSQRFELLWIALSTTGSVPSCKRVLTRGVPGVCGWGMSDPGGMRIVDKRAADARPNGENEPRIDETGDESVWISFADIQSSRCELQR